MLHRQSLYKRNILNRPKTNIAKSSLSSTTRLPQSDRHHCSCQETAPIARPFSSFYLKTANVIVANYTSDSSRMKSLKNRPMYVFRALFSFNRLLAYFFKRGDMCRSCGKVWTRLEEGSCFECLKRGVSSAFYL